MGLTDSLARLADAISEQFSLQKANRGDDKPVPAQTTPPEAPDGGPEAMLWDPFAFLETLGYRERYSMVSYDALRKLAYKVPVFPPILQIRRKQVLLFSKQQHDENEPGFEIRNRDKDASPSKKERHGMRDLEEWVSNTGASKAKVKDGFGAFLEKFIDDSLVLDQAAAEVVRNDKGLPADFYAVDGSSIRIVDAPWEDNIKASDDRIRYVQVHDNSVVNEFTPNQMMFSVRNPRTMLRCNGYGMSELESGMAIATGLIFGFQHNKMYFSEGTVAKGLLNLPQVPDKRLRIFSQQWHMIVSGIGRWRTPLTNFPDAKWIDLQKTNRDMEFGEWINFLIKIFAALELIDPVEFNFIFGNTGQTGQMFQSGTENRVKHSKDKGLRPLLMFVAEQLNRYLIWEINPEWELVFTGLDPKEAKQEVDIQKTKTTFLMTVDEQRKLNDLPAMKDGKGDVILDPTWLQFSNMKDQMAQQQMGGGMEQGMPPGAGGSPGGEQGPPEGGGEPPEEQGMSDEDWEKMISDAEKSAGVSSGLKKARVTETTRNDVIEYVIDLE